MTERSWSPTNRLRLVYRSVSTLTENSDEPQAFVDAGSRTLPVSVRKRSSCPDQYAGEGRQILRACFPKLQIVRHSPCS